MKNNKIKVGFIADDIDRQAMGTALYMQKLIEQYTKNHVDQIELVLIYREGKCKLPISNLARRLPIKTFKIPKYSGFFSFVRFFFSCPEKFDIIHFPRPKLFPFFWKLKAKKFVVTFHDAPEEGSKRFRTWHNYFFEWFIKYWGKYHIDAAIGDADYSAMIIWRYFKIDPNKTFGVKLASGSQLQPLLSEEVEIKKKEIFNKYGIHYPYILQVARLAPHKNVHRVIQAFDTLKQGGNYFHQLVILGGRNHAPWYDKIVDKAIYDAKYKKDIFIAPFIENGDMSAVYNLADIFVQAGTSDGFSLPIVDALKAGVAIVTSNQSVFPEIVGDAAILVNPYDIRSIADGMRQLLDNPELRKEKILLGLQKAKQYSWEKAAMDTISVYYKILE
jgi:glycosyltransferase involved in cell wall biosynthesis